MPYCMLYTVCNVPIEGGSSSADKEDDEAEAEAEDDAEDGNKEV